MLPGDHSQALFPSRPGRNGTQHLGGPLTYMEWVHMHCALCYISTYELEPSTQRRYRGAQAQFYEFRQRWLLSAGLSARHDLGGILFDSAIWGDGEIEQILIDFVLHETGVRGNSWSTVNGKLSAVRHANVQAGKGNPRDGKLRLKQLMAGLKKFRGPTGGERDH